MWAGSRRRRNVRRSFAAYAQLPAHEFHLIVIGDGQEASRLKKRRWNVPGCRRVRAAELARYYRAADLFVHPGVEETFGLVALESQACGTPVVGIRGSYMDDVSCTIRTVGRRENAPKRWRSAIVAMSGLDLPAMGAAAAAAGAGTLCLAAGLRATLFRLPERRLGLHGDATQNEAGRTVYHP